tara:strand:- start:5795 stop:6655 length:861 start_codon:yes stop_codon:yes gene_type:complete
MVILFIGGNGFLGKTLVNSFKSIENSISNSLLYGVKSYPKKTIDNSLDHYFLTDLNELELLSKINIDIVINTAVLYGRNDDQKLWETNVKMPLKLIEVIKNPDCLFINFGSFYTKHLDYVKLQNYRDSKIALREGLKKLEKRKTVLLHLEHIYGNYDSKNKFVAKMLDLLTRNVDEIELTECCQKRDFIHVSDVVQLIHLIINQRNNLNYCFNEFEVGTGESVAVKKLLQLMKKKTNSSTKLSFGSLNLNPNEIMDSKANIAPLNELFAWNPKVSLDQGIDDLISS